MTEIKIDNETKEIKFYFGNGNHWCTIYKNGDRFFISANSIKFSEASEALNIYKIIFP